MNILVIGGSGDIGKALIERKLKNKKNKIYNFDITDLKFNSSNYKYLNGSVLDRDSIVNQFNKINDKIDVVCLCFGIYNEYDLNGGFKGNNELLELNIIGTNNILELLYNSNFLAKISKITVINSPALFIPIPGVPAYSASKSAINSLVLAYENLFRKKGIYLKQFIVGFVDTPKIRIRKHSKHFLISLKKCIDSLELFLETKKVIKLYPLSIKVIVIIFSILPLFLKRFFIKLNS